MNKRNNIKTNQEFLADIMKDNNDLAIPEYSKTDFLEDPTPASKGSQMPALEDAVASLIIISGAKVKWNWNYWIVKRRDGSQCNLHAGADFQEWQTVLVIHST